ncbi:hypothetical protein ACIRJO_41125 [Streptomyces sp. NPDC102394]|uniref:hypothetical protein n=1 Tax=Streptomyces sp. NPDC102394 TaxID=3366167 RepID=UPI0038046103
MKTTTQTGDDKFATLCRQAWDTLIPARADYLAHVSPHYDEVLHDVAQRTEHTGSLGKTDIAALVVWKRLSAQTRWVTALMSLPDTHVRAVTERAVTAVRDTTLTRSEAARIGRGIIAELPGFHTGDALASAVLTAAAPQRMAVYDRRVQHALDTLGLTLTSTPGRYGRYLQLLDDLLKHGAAPAGWTARDIDTALYWTGKPNPAPSP